MEVKNIFFFILVLLVSVQGASATYVSVQGNGTIDTHVRSGQPTTGYGKLNTIQYGIVSTSNYESLIKFPITTGSNYLATSNATITLINSTSVGAPKNYSLYLLTSQFTNNTVWNNKSLYNSVELDTIRHIAGATELKFNISRSTFQGILDGTTPYYGFAIVRNPNSSTGTNYFLAHSTEAADSANWPKLEYNYTSYSSKIIIGGAGYNWTANTSYNDNTTITPDNKLVQGVFYDNFEDGINRGFLLSTYHLNINNSIKYGTYSLIQNRSTQVDGFNYSAYLNFYNSPHSIQVKFHDDSSNITSAGIGSIYNVSSGTPSNFMGYYSVINTTNYVSRMGASWNNTDIIRSSGWHDFRFDWDGTNFKQYLDNIFITQFEYPITTVPDRLRIGTFYTTSGTQYYDNIWMKHLNVSIGNRILNEINATPNKITAICGDFNTTQGGTVDVWINSTTSNNKYSITDLLCKEITPVNRGTFNFLITSNSAFTPELNLTYYISNNSNPIQQIIGTKLLNNTGYINFTINSSDPEGDNLTYLTNATKGTLNSTTGEYSYQFVSGDNNNYYWEFNTTDEYGATDSEIVHISTMPWLKYNLGNKSSYINEWINFTIVGDGILVNYSKGFSNGTIDTVTGNFSWYVNSSDIGIHNISFYVNDAYSRQNVTNITIVVDSTDIDIVPYHEIKSIIQAINHSDNYKYAVIAANQTGIERSMYALKIVNNYSILNSYIGVYNYWNETDYFSARVATSTDLINWTYRATIDDNYSDMPDIKILPDDTILITYEICPELPCRIRFRHYNNLSELFASRHDAEYTQNSWLNSGDQFGEGTPSIISYVWNGSIYNTTFNFGFHHRTPDGTAYPAFGGYDREGFGYLENWTNWTTWDDEELNYKVKSMGINASVGGRDYFSYKGISYNILEGQIDDQPYPETFWGTWRIFLQSNSSMDYLDMKTHGGSMSFSNPKASIVTLNGMDTLVVSLWIHTGGNNSAPGECCGTVYYKTLSTQFPPDMVTNLNYSSITNTSINWTWNDPANEDFDHVMVYMNGLFITNITKGLQYYINSSLIDNTEYIIGTRTTDIQGNTNQTWVNLTSRTYSWDWNTTNPTPVLISQSPDINSTNLIGQDLVIKYQMVSNFSDINESTVRFYFNTTRNGIINTAKINGTLVQPGAATIGFQPISNDGVNHTFNIPADVIYPLTANIIDANSSNSCSQSCHIGADYSTVTNPTNKNNIFKTRLFNISNETSYNYFEAMVNVTTVTGQSPALVYFCNASYTTGALSTSSNCAQIGSFLPKTTFDHYHTQLNAIGNLGHSIIPYKVNNTAGTINNITISPDDNYFAIKFQSTGWNIYYSNNVTRQDQTRLSTNNGVGYSNFSGTLRWHVHKFNNNDIFSYYTCYNSSSIGTQYCSAVTQDVISEADINPVGAVITTPNATRVTYPYNENMSINWTEGSSLTDGVILYYNLTLWQAGTFVMNIGNYSNTTLSTSWNPGEAPNGTYNFRMNTTSNKSLTTTTASILFDIYYLYEPFTPTTIISNTGNFYVNHSWINGTGNLTNLYNISINNVWSNGSMLNYNNTTYNPHVWSNISIYAYNSSGTGTLNQTSLTNNTRIPNNAPIQSSIGNKNVNEGSLLTFTISSTDADGDTLSFLTNATNGSLINDTFSYTPDYSASGTYQWEFNTTDNFTSVATETITVTVNDVILNYIPSVPTSLSYTNGTTWVNHTWSDGVGNITNSYNKSFTNGTWINDSIVNYLNETVGQGTYSNISLYAFNSSGSGTLSSIVTQSVRTPDIVIIPGTYNISGYINDTLGNWVNSATIQNGSNVTTSNSSGYYILNNINNGSYNYSFSKTGFNTNYSVIVINGSDNVTNITLSDTTAPGQVTGLTNATPTNNSINISWSAIIDANWYEIFKNDTHLNYTQNIYYNDTGLLDNHTYQYIVRVNDTYNNWGINSSVLNVTTGSNSTTPTPTPTPTSVPVSGGGGGGGGTIIITTPTPTVAINQSTFVPLQNKTNITDTTIGLIGKTSIPNIVIFGGIILIVGILLEINKQRNTKKRYKVVDGIIRKEVTQNRKYKVIDKVIKQEIQKVRK